MKPENDKNCIDNEVQGFTFAIKFFTCEARIGFTKEMVMMVANYLQQKYSQTSQSHYVQGFYDASIIIARTREHGEHLE